MSSQQTQKIKNRLRRKKRIRKKVYGTPDRPRLTVYRSLKHIYAQLIDDLNGKTLLSVSTLSGSVHKEEKAKTKVEAAKIVGTQLAKASAGKKIKKVVFDRNGYDYHGRVKALAEAARKEGLKF
ncbi:MAG: 50S ribosomal protein L18 [bacterium]